MRSILKRLGLGTLLYHSYHHPLALLQKSIREGGPLEQRRTESGRVAMEAAASSLSPIDSVAKGALELHVLTGRRYWYQTAFCLWTLARHAGQPVAPVIYDDGTLSSEYRGPLEKIFPLARFVMQSETIDRLDRVLPASRFPSLRERWLHYPNIRKLTDVHAGGSGWRLVIDSDLLFFRRADFLFDWLENPSRPLHAVDVDDAYGYSPHLLRSLAGNRIPERVNVGLCGLRSEAIDWDCLEHWCASLLEKEGAHYYLEQALVAMLLSSQDCAIAPAHNYVTLPALPEALECKAVMHHYVAESKRWYFQTNWKRAFEGQS